MNNKEGLVVILLLIFSIGAGFGGYYLGKYLDTVALETSKAINYEKIAKEWEEKSLDRKEYSKNQMLFLYSVLWRLEEKKHDSIADSFIATLTSPYGSVITIPVIDSKYKNIVNPIFCNINSTSSKNENSRECELVTLDDKSYAYFKESKDGKEIYYVAEKKYDSYIWEENKSIQYVLESKSDVYLVEDVLLSVVRYDLLD